MQIGYMRVSTGDQNPDAQRDALLKADVAVANVYVDHTSGAKSTRPQWDLVCRVLRPGDVRHPPGPRRTLHRPPRGPARRVPPA